MYQIFYPEVPDQPSFLREFSDPDDAVAFLRNHLGLRINVRTPQQAIDVRYAVDMDGAVEYVVREVQPSLSEAKQRSKSSPLISDATIAQLKERLG
jgi:hypothetical protein